MEHKKIIFVTIILIAVFFCSCDKSNTEEIKLIKKDSYFSDFWIDHGRVYIKCFLSAENLTEKEIKVKIKASSPEDVSGGF